MFGGNSYFHSQDYSAPVLLPTRGGQIGALSVICAAVAGCSSPGPPAAASTTPLSRAEQQSRYAVAAGAYHAQAAQTSKAESSYCDPSSPSADLNRCQMALSQDRQTTLSFDSALRSIMFTGQAGSDVARLLSDDASLEGLLEQAATAPSLSAIGQLTGQIFALLNTTAADASKVRGNLGLPEASPG
jgi:hypothetical protein